MPPFATDQDAIVRGVVESLPVGVWVARAPDGDFIYANSTFKEIMGMGARPDVGVGEYAEPYRIYGLDGDLYPEENLPFVRALRERETVMVDDIVIHRTDGRKVNIRAYGRPVADPSGEMSHVIVAFFDITREVEAERARAESERRMYVAQRMESIGNLAGGIAHDFNNLLGAIKGIASVLRAEENDEERGSDLEAIEAATDRAVELTRALLGFAGGGKNLCTPLSINRVVGSVADIIGRALDARILVDRELGATQTVVGDMARLEQVVMNLVINARDAMRGGGKLTLRTRDDGDSVVLEVEDDGPGVAPELRERIFEPYFTTKRADSYQGAGLGLATAYGIVESHNGSISVHDGSAGGAVFRVRLPAARGDAGVQRVDARAGRVVPGKGRVLVVDDEDAVLRAETRMLRAAGYEAVAVGGGAEAVELFTRDPAAFDAVVLDMSMPGLDGRSTYLALRELDPEVKVLLTTGYALNEQAQAILDLGVRGFVEKPFDLAAISEAMARLLSGG